MSETLRTYSAPITGRRRSHSFARFWGRIILIGVLIIIAWGFWSTRDTYTMERFIPADQVYQAFTRDGLDTYARLAASDIWPLLPKNANPTDWLAHWTSSLGLPKWTLSNLVYGRCHLSGNELDSPSDLLFLTRMSRVGATIEKFHSFLGTIDDDPAGGLDLRRLTESNLYYAVRGRILLASPSRQALILALTLRPEDSVSAKQLENDFESLTDEDLFARINFLDTSNPDNVLETLETSLWIDELRLTTHAVPHATAYAPFATLLENARPQVITEPLDGWLSIAGDFGKQIHEVWADIDQALQPMSPLTALTNALDELPEDGVDGIKQMVDTLTPHLETGWQITWNGIDTEAIVPVPQLVATLDANTTALQEQLEGLPPQEASAFTVPRYDAQERRYHLPLFGDPEIEPIAVHYGSTLLLSTSGTLAETIRDQAPRQDALPKPGNLYLYLDPKPALDAILDTADLLEKNALLSNDMQTYLQENAPSWQETAGRIQWCSLLIAHENGALDAEFKIELR